ncbi:MAG: lnt [Caulobacter sp.]|nr:lnt [Caulobacter sp.]
METRGLAWRDRGLAVLAGLAAALAHPPFGLLPGLLGYGLILWLLDRAAENPRPLRSAFLRGWLAGLAYFAVSTWWIAEAFFVDAANQGWMAPFAVTFMAAGLALFWGAAGVLYRLLKPRGVTRVLVFAGALALFEWLRGHVFTGFPWNLPGETWRAGSAPSQFASVVGAYGLTWITVAIAATVGLAPRRGRSELAAYGVAVAALLGLYGYGALRGEAASIKDDAPVVRIVQADVKQVDKYNQRVFEDIVHRYVALTARPPAKGQPVPQIIIWPEGAIPAAVNDYLAPGTWTRQAIQDALRPGQVLMLGAYRVEGGLDKPVYYNTFLVLRRTADGLELLSTYDKHRLVPFGEYLPAEGLLTAIGFKTLTHIGEGFSAGPKPRAIIPAGLPALQPLICYESLFPGFTREGIAAGGVRPAAIVNVSNDAWYGFTSGPLQNLNISSYRAIEEGVPMLRSTPTGVSAVVDSLGRIRVGERLELGVSGIIDARLPAVGRITTYSRLGDAALWLFLLISSLFGAWPSVASLLKRPDYPASGGA